MKVDDRVKVVAFRMSLPPKAQKYVGKTGRIVHVYDSPIDCGKAYSVRFKDGACILFREGEIAKA
jgi:hypothetical protein